MVNHNTVEADDLQIIVASAKPYDQMEGNCKRKTPDLVKG
jgi:hypothetical protein